MKKIALAMENFSRHGGGAESYAVALAETLINKGWQVHCYGERWDGEPDGAVFHEITVPKFLPTWLKMLHFAKKHRDEVNKQQFDVVLGFGNTIEMNVYQSHGGVHWYSTLRKVYSETNPLLRTLKRFLVLLSPKHHVRHWIESAPFRSRQHIRIIAISDMIKKDMAAYYKIDTQHIDLVYNGIDIQKFNKQSISELREQSRQALGVSEKDTVFLFVSFELTKKGIGPLIDGAALCKNSGMTDFKIAIVGGTPSAAIKRKIDKLDLDANIIFTGPTKNVQEMYAAGDVFILPTYYDACSLSVLEAMVCGLPAITTETNGIAGVIENGTNGLILTHPPQPVEIKDKMILLMDKERCKAMAESAHRQGITYTLDKNHCRMLEIINEAAAG